MVFAQVLLHFLDRNRHTRHGFGMRPVHSDSLFYERSTCRVESAFHVFHHFNFSRISCPRFWSNDRSRFQRRGKYRSIRPIENDARKRSLIVGLHVCRTGRF